VKFWEWKYHAPEKIWFNYGRLGLALAYLLLANSDMWRCGGIGCTECSLVESVFLAIGCFISDVYPVFKRRGNTLPFPSSLPSLCSILWHHLFIFLPILPAFPINPATGMGSARGFGQNQAKNAF